MHPNHLAMLARRYLVGYEVEELASNLGGRGDRSCRTELRRRAMNFHLQASQIQTQDTHPQPHQHNMTAIGSLVFCTDCGNLLESNTGRKAYLTCDVCGTQNKG